MLDREWLKKVPLLADFNLVLRQVLYNAGIDDASEFSSHSGKVTFLAIASCLGAETRAKLGYHKLAKEPKSTLAYDRNRLRWPIQRLQYLIDEEITRDSRVQRREEEWANFRVNWKPDEEEEPGIADEMWVES